MLNNDNTELKQPTQAENDTATQPDERGSIHIQGHIKIFDPETNETFIEARA